jgi:hypothetical protein
MSHHVGEAAMDEPILLERIESVLSAVRGQRIWSVLAGRGTGSVFSLAIGRQLTRRIPVRNPTLSELERTHEGEFRLMVECAWWLERQGQTICTWRDDNAPGARMLTGLSRLKEQMIDSITVLHPSLDLDMVTSGQLRLRTVWDRQTCYFLSAPAGGFTALSNGRIVLHDG